MIAFGGLGSKYNYFGLESKLSSTLYSALPVDFSIQESNINKVATSDIKVRAEEDSLYKNNVYFRDPLNNAYIQTGLSDENLYRLQNVFGENSIKKDDKGNILLKGEAEKFVSGWFGDIAYKRGYIKADVNKDGFLDTEERANTNSFTIGLMLVEGNRVDLLPGDATYVELINISPAYDNARLNKLTSHSIEEELNKTIALDGDFNGSITFGQTWKKEDLIRNLDALVDYSGKGNNGLILLTADELISFLKERDTDKNLKKILEEKLKKLGIEIKNTPAGISEGKMLEKLIESEDSLEKHEELKKDSILKKIQDLTKLSKDTLERNLTNNSNFEEDIIHIVQELVKNVDAKYSKNTLDFTIKTSLDLSV